MDLKPDLTGHVEGCLVALLLEAGEGDGWLNAPPRCPKCGKGTVTVSYSTPYGVAEWQCRCESCSGVAKGQDSLDTALNAWRIVAAKPVDGNARKDPR